MQFPFFNRLYVRIWLAVVAAVLVLTMIFGWIWREHIDRQRAERANELPARELVLRDASGKVLGKASSIAGRSGSGLEFDITLPNLGALAVSASGVAPATASYTIQVSPRRTAGGSANTAPRWLEGNMQRNPGFMLLLWGVLAAGIALGSYPVVRRLTQRLEKLQRSVERWGAGDLAARVDAQGHDEVAYLAQRFNQAADRIEALVQAHKALLANASHELRSPLARIRMGLELTHTSPSPALQAELSRSINELDTLIDEILLASRLDAAQHSQSIDLGPRDAVNMLDLAAQECARLSIPLQVLPDLPNTAATATATATAAAAHSVQGIERLLKRLVRNLLENAQRYGGGQAEMTLRWHGPGSHHAASALNTAGYLELTISDRGPGVPPAERERIFEPFYRSSNASERDGGVGLGLSLVQQIARSHGGSVLCLPREGGGACFVVKLPHAA